MKKIWGLKLERDQGFFFKTFKTKCHNFGFRDKNFSSLFCCSWSTKRSCRSLVDTPIGF
jgi:hypothetical protein